MSKSPGISSLGGWAALAAGLTALVTMNMSGASDSSTFSVYRSVDECAASGNTRGECQSMADQASKSAASLNWQFASGAECLAGYGSGRCYKDSTGAWRVHLAGFTPFLTSDNGFRLVLPVFASETHGGTYLPNGYPVVAGKNVILKTLKHHGGYLASKARSLEATFCVEGSSGKDCRPAYEWLSRVSVSKAVLKALFSTSEP